MEVNPLRAINGRKKGPVDIEAGRSEEIAIVRLVKACCHYGSQAQRKNLSSAIILSCLLLLKIKLAK
jgi:hypothetical protein